MPQSTRAQLILIELAVALLLGGYVVGDGALRSPWTVSGLVGAVLAVALAVVALRRRWLYQLLGSWGGMRRRRWRAARRPGLAGLLGEYQVEAVPGGTRGGDLGVVRSGTTWSLPLGLGLDGVFNDDAAVPIRLLTGLLQVEDVPLSSVRLLTLTTPARIPANAPQGPGAPIAPLAARYCLLTLDTRRAAEAVASRGGSLAAVHQILRRCAVHTEQVLATAGLPVRRLDEHAVARLFTTWLGAADPPDGHRGHSTQESRQDVRVAGTWSTVFAVTGTGSDVLNRVSRLAAAAPTPVVATSLLLQPAGTAGPTETGSSPTAAAEATMLLRLTAPESSPHADAASSLALLARAFDLVMQRVDGEQATLLRATTPLGVGEPA